MKKKIDRLLSVLTGIAVIFCSASLQVIVDSSAVSYPLNGLDPEDSPIKPTLSLSRITLTLDEIKKDPVQTVELTVKGAKDNYVATGLHIEYDSRLTLVKPSKEECAVLGAAGKNMNGTRMSKEDQTCDAGKKGIFVSTFGTSDSGADGVLWSFDLKIPDSARAGDIYPIEIVYKEQDKAKDLFINFERNLQGRLMEAWVFTNGIEQGFIKIADEKTTPSVKWGSDNWSFNNLSDNFGTGDYASQIKSSYRESLSENLTNREYQVIFKGYSDFSGNRQQGWIGQPWGGSGYGMSSTALLKNHGLLPYSKYSSGANSLFDLLLPSDSPEVSSLINYYQMLQVKDIVQQQYRTVPQLSHKENIKHIISLLKENSCVLVGYKDSDRGSNTVLAYDHENAIWSWNNVIYDSCIRVIDPNHSIYHSDKYDIYFDSETYDWIVPAYNGNISSVNGSVFNYVGADINEINNGGYLSGTSSPKLANYVARIDTESVAGSHSVEKVKKSGTGYLTQNSSPGEIVADISFAANSSSDGIPGYNLSDLDSAYKVTQKKAGKLQLSIDYENCLLRAGSAAGTEVIFDKDGVVSIEGEAADYNVSMVFNSGYPTDWFAFEVTGQNAGAVLMKKTSSGYVLEADNLQGVKVCANNKVNSSEVRFTTAYNKVLLYEINEYTIGVSVDKDGNGTYESTIAKSGRSSVYGDVNLDGELKVSDIVLLQKYLLSAETLTKYQYETADLNKDGKVDTFDLCLIRKALTS